MNRLPFGVVQADAPNNAIDILTTDPRRLEGRRGCSLQQHRQTRRRKQWINVLKQFQTYLVVGSLVVVLYPFQGLARQDSDAAKNSVQHTGAERDGQHDFDFELGTWKIHLKRLVHPLTGSTTWVEFDGTSVTRKVWDGRSQLEEFKTDSPSGGQIEGMTLRLYDPQTHQWSLYWATSKSGTMGAPTIGEFKDGSGEFYDTEPSGPHGKSILVRFI
jgi:hypothetical protein